MPKIKGTWGRGINDKSRKSVTRLFDFRLEMLEGAKLMGAGAATIALAGAAVGIGNVFSSSIHSVAINPSLAKQLFGSKKRASPRKCPFLCRWG